MFQSSIETTSITKDFFSEIYGGVSVFDTLQLFMPWQKTRQYHQHFVESINRSFVHTYVRSHRMTFLLFGDPLYIHEGNEAVKNCKLLMLQRLVPSFLVLFGELPVKTTEAFGEAFFHKDLSCQYYALPPFTVGKTGYQAVLEIQDTRGTKLYLLFPLYIQRNVEVWLGARQQGRTMLEMIVDVAHRM